MITDARSALGADRAARRRDARTACSDRRGRPRTMTFREYRDAAERAAAGLAELGVGEGTPVSWAAADVDRVDRARGRARPARRGPEPDPADLPRPRGRLRDAADRRQAADRPVGVEGLRLRGAWRARSPPRTPGLEVLVVRPQAARGRPGVARRRWRRPVIARRRRPVRWVFYTSGTTADPKGAQHTDRTRHGVGVRAWTTALAIEPDDVQRARVPVHPHRRDRLAVHRLDDGRAASTSSSRRSTPPRRSRCCSAKA